jgi:histone-lysine N-methyltransferase SETMAR
MRHISAKFVPRLLSDDQKAHRVSFCRELKQQATDDPNFISSIITSDETWVYGYDPETKQQLSQWKSLKKVHQVRSNVKSMLIFFSTSKQLSTRNSYSLLKLSMASSKVRFSSG